MGDSDIRLAAVCRGWHDCPPEANPYSDVFSLDAARRWSREQIEAFAGLLDQAGEGGADLAVAGEDIAYLGYAMSYLDDPSIFRTLASETAAQVHEILGEVARRRGAHLVASFFEPEGDQIFNVAVLWGGDGEVIGRYRKVHLPAVETWLITPGDSFPAFETGLGLVGMLICYDDMWPESTAACALNGARIICHPSAATPTDWRLRTRAADAQVFYISATTRRSRIVSPSAHILADTEERSEPVAAADVNLADASVCDADHWEYIYSGIRDHRERHLKLRRAHAYGPLLDPNPPALEAYPAGGLADPRAAYEKQKVQYRKGLRGEKQDYTWQWTPKLP
ncbi:MAG: carbon-nitrogen hydrolase family protein [Armatimonadota bacterium]|nr:MAG: carbon-nitrogen hydrolase family protein [Armatimonadota bacterium]